MEELRDLSRLLALSHPGVRPLEFDSLPADGGLFLLGYAEWVLERLPELQPVMEASTLVSGEAAGFAAQVEKAADGLRGASRQVKDQLSGARAAVEAKALEEAVKRWNPWSSTDWRKLRFRTDTSPTLSWRIPSATMVRDLPLMVNPA